MIILSQDKRQTTESLTLRIEQEIIKNIDNESTELKIGCSRIFDKDNRFLGAYETEERAKEVLQEIVNKYRQWNVDNNKAITIIPKVYEMPKE